MGDPGVGRPGLGEQGLGIYVGPFRGPISLVWPCSWLSCGDQGIWIIRCIIHRLHKGFDERELALNGVWNRVVA